MNICHPDELEMEEKDKNTTIKEYYIADLNQLPEMCCPSVELISKLEAGDRLFNYHWYAGPLAERFGWYLTDRNKKAKYHELCWLS